MNFDADKFLEQFKTIAKAEAGLLADQAKLTEKEAADVQKAVEAEAKYYLTVGTLTLEEQVRAANRVRLYRSGFRNLAIARAINIEDEVRDAARRTVRKTMTLGLNIGLALLA